MVHAGGWVVETRVRGMCDYSSSVGKSMLKIVKSMVTVSSGFSCDLSSILPVVALNGRDICPNAWDFVNCKAILRAPTCGHQITSQKTFPV